MDVCEKSDLLTGVANQPVDKVYSLLGDSRFSRDRLRRDWENSILSLLDAYQTYSQHKD